MQHESENIRSQIKENIQVLIENNQLNDADILVDEYFKISNNDIEAYSMKSVILMLKGQIDEAEELLLSALNYNNNDFDLNYNLGYIYYNKKQYELGLQYYIKAYITTNDKEIRKNIKQIIKEMLSELNLSEDVEEFLKMNIIKSQDSKGQRYLILCHFYSVYTKEFLEKIYNETNVKFDILTIDSSYKEKVRRGIIENVYTYNDLNKMNEILNSKEQYDIIHIHFLTPFYGEVAEQIRSKCKKLIITIWGSDFYRTTTEQKEQQRKLVDKADVITFDNDVTMEDFAKYYDIRNKGKLSINRFGLTALEYIRDLENTDSNQIKAEYNIPENSIVITCGYNANPAHNHLEIIKSIKQIKNKLPKNIYYIFPMTYSRDEKYCDIVKEELSKSGLKYIVLEEFMNFAQMAKLTKVTDIMIQLQTTDTLSATMQEHMYHGNVVITGSWLPYKPLKEIGTYFLEVSSINKIGAKLANVLKDFSIIKQRCKKNRRKIWDFSSWNNTVGSWIDLYYKKKMDINKIGNRKKVLVIAYFFPPLGGAGVQRTLKYVKYLREFGWEPIVVTVGRSNYFAKDETLLSEIPEGVTIVRIDDVENDELTNKFLNKLINLYSEIVNNQELMNIYYKEINKNNENLQKLLFMPDFYSAWGCKVLEVIEQNIKFDEIDLIYTTSSPICDHIIGYCLKQKYDIPWVADFRDEWTNNPYVEYDKKSIKYTMEHYMENNIVQSADKVITITSISSDNYRKNFNLDNNKVITITNGYDEDDFIEIKCPEIKNDKFTIIHNGLLYGIRTPETFLLAVKNLISKNLIDKDKLEICLTRTSEDENLKRYIEVIGLTDNIKCLGYLSHKESLQLSNRADLLLLIIGQGEKCKGVFTGKIFEYLRLNKPILSLAPSGGVVDVLIKETDRGCNIEFDKVQDIEEYILYVYNKWSDNSQNNLSINDQIRRFDRKELTKSLCDVFRNVCDDESLVDNCFFQKSDDLEIYEELKVIDMDRYFSKVDILINKGQLEDAENILKRGIEEEHDSFGLFYRLAYIYKITGRYVESRCCYILCKHISNNKESAEKIEEKILEIENEHYDILKSSIEINGEKFMDYKIKVILYGTKNGIKKVKSKLNHKFEVIGYICDDDTIEFEDLVLKISLNEINKHDFDYVITADKGRNINHKLLSVGIASEKIFEYFEHDLNCQIEGFEYMLRKLLKSNEIEVLVIGASDTEVGIDCNLIEKPAINFSLSGQDIFYIYRTIKYLLNFENIRGNLKFVILGLQYFSFDFDLSTSLGKYRIHRYYENLKTIHNNTDELAIEILTSIYNKKNIEHNYEKVKKLKIEANLQEKDEQLGQYYATLHSTMNNSKVFKENKKILKELFKLLKDNGIKPIIAVCPTSKYYNNHYIKESKERFYNVIEELKKMYDFKFIDYFDSSLFTDEDFYNYAHLNANGAIKFTRIISEQIEF